MYTLICISTQNVVNINAYTKQQKNWHKDKDDTLTRSKQIYWLYLKFGKNSNFSMGNCKVILPLVLPPCLMKWKQKLAISRGISGLQHILQKSRTVSVCVGPRDRVVGVAAV